MKNEINIKCKSIQPKGELKIQHFKLTYKKRDQSNPNYNHRVTQEYENMRNTRMTFQGSKGVLQAASNPVYDYHYPYSDLGRSYFAGRFLDS